MRCCMFVWVKRQKPISLIPITADGPVAEPVTVKRSLFIVSIRTAYQSEALAIQPPVHNSAYAISALSCLFFVA